ncbi:MAG: methylated-DNA--[protein]-cysteine S-methyltransferase [Flavobacteriaceae bacterium]
MSATFTYESPIGKLLITLSDSGIKQIKFVEDETNGLEIVAHPSHEIVKQIQEYFDLKRTAFTLPLDLQGTVFQKKVWQALLAIPFGTTLSYLKVAQKLGDPKKVRAVAAAIAKNPVLILVPCHRVIGSDAKLVGYSGGLQRKQALLKLEGFQFQNSLF